MAPSRRWSGCSGSATRRSRTGSIGSLRRSAWVWASRMSPPRPAGLRFSTASSEVKSPPKRRWRHWRNEAPPCAGAARLRGTQILAPGLSSLAADVAALRAHLLRWRDRAGADAEVHHRRLGTISLRPLRDDLRFTRHADPCRRIRPPLTHAALTHEEKRNTPCSKNDSAS